MRTLVITILVSFWVLTSCRQETNTSKQKATAHKSTFTFHRYDIDLDTSIEDIEIFNNDIICLLDNGKIVVLDSNYRRNYEAEQRLTISDTITAVYSFNKHLICRTRKSFNIFDSTYKNSAAIERKLRPLGTFYMYLFHDTNWLATEKAYYILNQDFSLIPFPSNHNIYKNRPMLGPFLIYEDSLYWVYDCSFGEDGANVFFENKRNQEITTYPVVGRSQIIRLNNTYFAFSSLGHLSGNTQYMTIKDPSLLYAYNNSKHWHNGSFCCNCDDQNEQSIYRYHHKDSVAAAELKKGIQVYYDKVGILTPITFAYNNNIYSLQLLDSGARIVKHQADTVVTIDTLPNIKAIRCAHAFFNGQKNTTIYCRMYGNSWFSNNNGNAGYISYSGILLVKGKKIELIEYYKNTSSYK